MYIVLIFAKNYWNCPEHFDYNGYLLHKTAYIYFYCSMWSIEEYVGNLVD